MIPNFNERFDSYLTQAKHYRNYLEAKGYSEDDFGNYTWQPQDPADIEEESIEYHNPPVRDFEEF